MIIRDCRYDQSPFVRQNSAPRLRSAAQNPHERHRFRSDHPPDPQRNATKSAAEPDSDDEHKLPELLCSPLKSGYEAAVSKIKLPIEYKPQSIPK